MGIILRLTAPAANMDPRMDPPVETGDYMVSDPSNATTLTNTILSSYYWIQEVGCERACMLLTDLT